MASPLPSVLMDDLVSVLKAGLPDLNDRIVYGPPEQMPSALSIWIEYGPVEFEWGLMAVSLPTVSVSVGIPRKGNYPGEYRVVTDTAYMVSQALKGDLLLASEATITSMTVGRASGALYAGTEIVSCVITLGIETKQDNTGENL